LRLVRENEKPVEVCLFARIGDNPEPGGLCFGGIDQQVSLADLDGLLEEGLAIG